MEPGSFRERLSRVKALPHSERRASFEILKQDIHRADELATQIANDLWIWAQQDPPPEADEFREYISTLEIPDWMEKEVMGAIDAYEVRRQRIKYFQMWEPTDLFHECFGFWPKESVDMRVSAATIDFFVYSDEDYSQAYASPLQKDPEKFAKQKDRALSSGGCAFGSTRLPDSQNIFTLIRVPRENQETVLSKNVIMREAEIRPDGRVLVIDTGSVTVFHSQQFAAIEFERKDGRISGITMDQCSREATVMLGDKQIGHLGMLFDQEEVEAIVTFKDVPGKIRLRIDSVTGRVEIRNRMPIEVGAEILFYERVPKYVSSKRVEDIVAHEEQHQWNALFLPSYSPSVPILQQMTEIVKRSKEDVNTGAEEFIQAAFAHSKMDARLGAALRRAEVRGRDEILAFYRDGRTPQAISSILEGTLYNYFEADDELILTKEIEGYFESYRMMYRMQFQGKNPGALSKEYVQRFIQGLKLAYRKEVLRGLAAIESLEAAQFSRNEIIAMLYTANLPEWSFIAKRAIERNASEKRSLTAI